MLMKRYIHMSKKKKKLRILEKKTQENGGHCISSFLPLNVAITVG